MERTLGFHHLQGVLRKQNVGLESPPVSPGTSPPGISLQYVDRPRIEAAFEEMRRAQSSISTVGRLARHSGPGFGEQVLGGIADAARAGVLLSR